MVLEYTKPQMGGGNVAPVDPATKIDGTPMTGGYISIQAETAPTDFRKIELLNLEGDKGAGALLDGLGEGLVTIPAPDDGVLFDVDYRKPPPFTGEDGR